MYNIRVYLFNKFRLNMNEKYNISSLVCTCAMLLETIRVICQLLKLQCLKMSHFAYWYVFNVPVFLIKEICKMLV